METGFTPQHLATRNGQYIAISYSRSNRKKRDIAVGCKQLVCSNSDFHGPRTTSGRRKKKSNRPLYIQRQKYVIYAQNVCNLHRKIHIFILKVMGAVGGTW
jgi:hypothetical protein